MVYAHSKLSCEQLEQRRYLSAVSFVPHDIVAIAGLKVRIAADVDGDGDVDVLAGSNWYENVALQAGDANRDLQFDQQDVVQVLQAAKYLTGQPATFAEGDWNDDGFFNQLDIIAALQTGNYLQGPYASLAKSDREADVDEVFDELGLQPLIRPI